MEEQRKLRKQFLIHIVYNMIAFALIFIAFGIFMFYMIKHITFSVADHELKEAKSEFADVQVTLESLYKIFDLGNVEFFKNKNLDFLEYNLTKRINNPQINLILRNETGEILNANDLGKLTDYSQEIEFDNQYLNAIYTLSLENEYNYRCLNFKINENDEKDTTYAQLLINVDSEIELINNYLEITISAVVLGIFLSGIASFILSKKTLQPIQETLKVQTEFVQNAAHELRTPLTIIQAKQELLLQEPNSKIIDKSEDISLTLNETKRLSKLTKDLMILVRGNNLRLQKEDVNVDEFIRNVVLPYQDMAEAQGKRLILNLNFQKEMSLDIHKTHQLLVILLDNSIKYTEERRRNSNSYRIKRKQIDFRSSRYRNWH